MLLYSLLKALPQLKHSVAFSSFIQNCFSKPPDLSKDVRSGNSGRCSAALTMLSLSLLPSLSIYPGRWYLIEDRVDLSVFVETERVTRPWWTCGCSGTIAGGGVAILPSHRMLTLLTLGDGCLMVSFRPSRPTTGAISLTDDVSRSDNESGKMLLLGSDDSSWKWTCSSFSRYDGVVLGVREWTRDLATEEAREWLRSFGSTPETADDAADVMLLNLE